MKIFDTVLGRWFPTSSGGTDEGQPFDFWRLPNDPTSPHVAAMRDLFLTSFSLAAEQFDALTTPEPGTDRRLIAAARHEVICAGILYQMPSVPNGEGGYVSFIATRRNVRSHGAGRILLGLAHDDFIVNGHPISRLVRLDPRHTNFFEAAGYERTPGGGYGDMHAVLDLSPASRAAAQARLNVLMTLY